MIHFHFQSQLFYCFDLCFPCPIFFSDFPVSLSLLRTLLTVWAHPHNPGSSPHLKRCVCMCVRERELLSRVQLFVTPWTVAHQALLSMAFPRQEYWSGLSFPSPGDLPDSGIKPGSPALAGRFFTTEPPGKPTSLLGSHSACHTGPQHSPSLPVATWPGPEPLGARSQGLGNLGKAFLHGPARCLGLEKPLLARGSPPTPPWALSLCPVAKRLTFSFAHQTRCHQIQASSLTRPAAVYFTDMRNAAGWVLGNRL